MTAIGNEGKRTGRASDCSRWGIRAAFFAVFTAASPSAPAVESPALISPWTPVTVNGDTPAWPSDCPRVKSGTLADELPLRKLALEIDDGAYPRSWPDG